MCPICDSPLRDFEWMPHVRSCMLIEARRTGRTDAEIMTELRELQAQATSATPFPHS